MIKIFLTFLVVMSTIQKLCSHGKEDHQDLKIVTLDSPLAHILHQKAIDISSDEFSLAEEIADKLIRALTPLMPAAGLAAPQLGINRSVFIYSYDRNPRHLEVVINPTFQPISNEQIIGWEACFSVVYEGNWMLAQVPRYEKIQVKFFNLKGEKIKRVLDGFAAKVFQHEYDHLQGVECINHPQAVVKNFSSKGEMDSFLQAVKKEDAQRYIKPAD